MKKERLTREVANKITRISAQGLILVVATYLGLYLGLYLDKLTDMAPNFTLVFLILGVVLGFKGFVEEVAKERRA